MCIRLKLYENRLYKINLTEDYREIDSIQIADEWGRKHYGEWVSQYKTLVSNMRYLESISSYARMPIEAFCGYGYKLLNEFLRNKKESEKENPYLQSFADVLQYTICSAPKIPENIIVYRLVCDDVIRELLSNNIYHYCEKGFMSTSLYSMFYQNSKEDYVNYENLLKIYVNKGTMALYASLVDYRNEGEVLFLPNTALGLIKKPYKINKKIVYECIMLSP